MTRTKRARRWAFRTGAAMVATLVMAGGVTAAAQAQAPETNPYAPSAGHPYRHGAVPTQAAAAQMRAWEASHQAGHRPTRTNNLAYGGGIDGIGVTTGSEKVYLVFWGSQWGAPGTGGTLSGDPSGEGPYLQALFKGLGTNGELWSGVMTQYCDGVSIGATSCPSTNASHVAYPTGGALAGVWNDESLPAPNQASAAQLGTEAVLAAEHFGNTAATSNRDAQYVILSPTGTHPDGFNTAQGNFCAWHDWNGDPYVGVNSPYGDIAFTNMPYVTDMGASCGQGFVNGNTGTLDGVSIVEGHEYAETITDQNPAGGWTDSGGSENGDKCAWITPGTPGGAANLPLGSAGNFAMQSTWANDSSTCEFSHAIVANGSTGGTETVTVTNPGSQRTKVGRSVRLQITATDSIGSTLTYSATGLPIGLSIDSSGLISGVPSTVSTYNVTVTVAAANSGVLGSTQFTWTITH